MFVFALIGSVTLLASQVFAFPNIQVRQFNAPGNVSSSCTDVCNAVENLELCSPGPQCSCTEDLNEAVVTCYDCILDLDGHDPTEMAILQSGLSDFENLCSTMGHPLSSLTLDGAQPTSGASPIISGGSAATTPPASSATSSGASTAIVAPSTPTLPTAAPSAPSAPTTPSSPSTPSAPTAPVSPTPGGAGAGTASGADSDTRVGPFVALASILGSVLGFVVL